MSLRVYVARPISGCSFEEVTKYYLATTRRLRACGARVYHPMVGKEKLRCEKKFKSVGYDGIPCATNHAITERDFWMVEQADIVFINLEVGTAIKEVSIGCISELTAGHILRKHTVVVMNQELKSNGEPVNIHNHCFPLHCADVIFPNYEDTMKYLEELIGDVEDRYPYEQPKGMNKYPNTEACGKKDANS